MSYFLNLPIELIIHISEYLTVDELKNFMDCQKAIRNHFWKIWKMRFCKDFTHMNYRSMFRPAYIKWITLLRERHLLLGNINKYRHTLIHLFKDFKEDLITMKINNQCIMYLINYRKIPQMNDNVLDLMLTRLISARQFNIFEKLWNEYEHLTKRCQLINYLPDVVKIDDLSIVMKFAHFIVDHPAIVIHNDCFKYKNNNQIQVLYQDESLFRKLIPLLDNQSKWDIALWPIISIDDFITIFNSISFGHNSYITMLLDNIIKSDDNMIDLKEKILFLIAKIDDHMDLLRYWEICEYFIFNDLLDIVNVRYENLIETHAAKIDMLDHTTITNLVSKVADKEKLIVWASLKRYINLVKCLLSDFRPNPMILKDWRIFYFFLINDLSVDFNYDHAVLLRIHALKIHGRDKLSLSKIIHHLTDENKQQLLFFASKKGYILFIKALFSDPNFDPTLFNYRCLKLAKEHNKQTLINFMLSDARFNGK